MSLTMNMLIYHLECVLIIKLEFDGQANAGSATY